MRAISKGTDTMGELHTRLSRMKAPIILPARGGVTYHGAHVVHAEDGYHLTTVRREAGLERLCVSHSQDLIGWSIPEQLPENAGTDAAVIPGAAGGQADAAAVLRSADGQADAVDTTLYDGALGMYLRFYSAAGSIAVAASADQVHWQTFTRDHATYPDNGVIYEGDYYKGIPYSQYIEGRALPEDAPVFDIRRYGAIGDGATLCTEAFRAAAEAARDAGGGIVLVAGGRYCTGTVQLYSNTTLWIDRDAALCASKDLAQYDDALVKFVNAENVSITGGGRIVGNGEYHVYLPLKRPLTEPLPTTKLPPHLYDPMGYPVDSIRYAYRSRIRYAEDRYAQGLAPIPRPMYTVWIRGCHHADIQNIIIEDALDWTLVLDCSEHVTVQDLVIDGNRHVANTDGIDIMGSRDVEVRHCFVSCADDGICIKSPLRQGHDGINVAEADAPMSGAQDIHIEDCTVVSVMNAFKIGTETYYDISNVTVEHCRFLMPDIYPGGVSGISIESADGSHVRNITVRDVEMDRICCPLFICLNMRNKYGYLSEEDRQARQYGGAIENVLIEDVRAYEAEVPSIVTGFRTERNGVTIERCVENIHIDRFRVVYRDNVEILAPEEQVYENVVDYPENNAFGDVPASGLYVRHAQATTLTECEIVPRTTSTRPAIVVEQPQVV